MAVEIGIIIASTATRLEGQLCSSCWTSAMWHVELVTLTMAGVTPFGSWTGCVGCGQPGEVERT